MKHSMPYSHASVVTLYGNMEIDNLEMKKCYRRNYMGHSSLNINNSP